MKHINIIIIIIMTTFVIIVVIITLIIISSSSSSIFNIKTRLFSVRLVILYQLLYQFFTDR